MKAFAYGVLLQWKIDVRRKDVFVTYYIVPLVFFFFMGGVFVSAMPGMKVTLISAMTIFALSLGGYMGVPLSISAFYQSDLKKAYKVGGIPLWTPLVNSFLSAFIHLALVACIICLVSPLAFNAEPLNQAARYIIATAGLLCANGAISILLGLFIKSASKISMVAVLLFLPSVVLSGIMMPAEFLPEILQTIGNFFPATWAYQAMNGVDFELNTLFLFGLFGVLMIVNLVKLRRISQD